MERSALFSSILPVTILLAVSLGIFVLQVGF
jgi:hypothetical protein